MIDWEDCSATLEKHKTSKLGKTRTIYFCPAMMGLLRRLAKKHPAGLLFRTRNGHPWDSNACARWVRVFADELGIKEVIMYTFRHNYICDALERDVPLALLAELVGNSAAVLLKYYVPMTTKKDALKAAARQAIG